MKMTIEINKKYIILDKGDGYPTIYSMTLYDAREPNVVQMAIIQDVNEFTDSIPARWLKC